jgi:hypothetical protein
MSAATTLTFTHPNSYVGTLIVENGIDQAQWAYNLNTQVYPTYGGEVVQILSVYIDDLTLGGSITTYQQAELIYAYFARYFQVATQGRSGTPNISSGDAYNLKPMRFQYPMRGWDFKLYPKSAPGFRYDVETVNPVWVMTAHIIDEHNEGGGLQAVKSTIQDAAVKKLMSNTTLDTFGRLTDQISPNSGDPNTDPFQTFNEGDQAASKALGGLSDYYASLINGYQNGNFAGITGGVGSKPTSTSASTGASSGAKTKTKSKGNDRITKTASNSGGFTQVGGG